MNLKKLRQEVITKALENTMREVLSHEIGIELKRSMSIVVAADAQKSKALEAAIFEQESHLEDSKRVLQILERKLDEADNEK